MLTIRLQRTGRTGHAQFRVIVQDRRAHPKSGRIVAYVGSYNPHTKAAIIDKDKINNFLGTGAVPSDRVARLLVKEGVKLPDWYKAPAPKKKEIRNPDKRRSTRPPEEHPKDSTEQVVGESESQTPAPTEEVPAEATETESSEPEASEEPVPETPAEEAAESAAQEGPAEATGDQTEPPAEADAEGPAEKAAE